MIALTVGMNLKCLSGMGIHSGTFYDDIMSGYNLFSLDFSALELLLLLMDKNGDDEQPYSMTTLVNIKNRKQTENFNIQIVNHFVNTFVRLLRGAGTYRDYLYINNFLGKAGINDTYSFTRLMSAYVNNIENRERIDNIYKNIAESDLQSEIKSYFASSKVRLLKDDNRYNRTYERYLEAVRSNAEFIMNLSSVSFDRPAMELELTKSKFLMELLKIDNAAYGKNILNGSEVQKNSSAYMDNTELYAANITADMYINPFVAISKNMEYGIAGADRYFNGDMQKVFAGAVCEIIKRVYRNGVQKYISAENEKTENKYIEKYTGNKYIGNKYTGSKYTENKYTGNKYIGNKYIENKHIGNGRADYAAGTANIGKYHGTEIFQLENTDINTADVVNNVYNLMREKFAYVQNYSMFIDAETAAHDERLNSENNIYNEAETVYNHSKSDIRYNTDYSIENNTENNIENNIDDNSKKTGTIINKISETGSDIQYNSYSYGNEEFYKNNTENYMSSQDGGRGGYVSNNFENDIKNNIENDINIKNSIENNIENSSNSDKKNVINMSERKSSTTEHKERSTAVHGEDGTVMQEINRTTENIFMDSIDADIKHIGQVRQYIDIAEQFIAAEKIYLQNHGDDKEQTARSTIHNNILKQNDILQQNNTLEQSDIQQQSDTQQQNDASWQNAASQETDSDGAVMFHVDNQVELQRLEELLSFEFSRTGKTNIFQGNTKTENKNETRNISQRYLDLQSFAETLWKIIQAQNVHEQAAKSQILHTQIANVQNLHAQSVHTQSARVQSVPELSAGKYPDIADSFDMNYGSASEDMRLENIQNINPEGAHSENAQNINPEAVHSENIRSVGTEILYSGDTQNTVSGNIQSVNSDEISSENINLGNTQNVNPKFIYSEDIQNTGAPAISLGNTQDISLQALHSDIIQNVSSENMYSEGTFSENTQNTGSEIIYSGDTQNIASENTYSETINYINIQNLYPENFETDIYMSYLTGNSLKPATAKELTGISQSNVVLSFPGGEAQESGDTGMYNAQQMNSTTVRNVSNESTTTNYSSNISNATDVSNYGYSDRMPGSQTRQQDIDYESGMERKISNVIANQINNISERVYGQLERRLENEWKRRGI